MSDIALGYGSKWHLLRYLGYHRVALNRAVEDATGGRAVCGWLDTLVGANRHFLDVEWTGLEIRPKSPLH
jgi:hypothetical protein